MFRGAVRIASVGFLVVWLFWMDVCLYYHIRTLKCNYNNDTNTVSHLYKAGSRLTFGPGTGTGNKDKTSITSGRLKPIYATINELPSLVSYHHHDDDKRARWLLGMFSFAFRGMSVKLIMSDPVDNYLMGPLTDAFGDLCNFRVNFQFVSANMISFAGLLSALVAAKLVARQNSPTSHKLAFIFFQLRTWLDCLDGVVARSRLGITNHVSLQNTFGYLVDGVCDTLGFAAFIWGIYIYLKHWHFISYLQIPKQEESSRTETAPRPSHRRLLVLIALFSIQLALCAAGWNKYILEYNKLLGSPSTSHFEAESKLKILKSNIMFIIVWFWRLTNGHSWMQFLAISVLMGKIWHFLEFIKFIGLVEIIILVTVTQLHTIDVKNFLTI